MAVSSVPVGHHTVAPYLIVEQIEPLIAFLQHAFDAKLVYQLQRQGGEVNHAELQIGDSRLYLGLASEGWGPFPCMVHLYTDDADAWYRRALEAGARSFMEVADQYYGDRAGGLIGPQGNYWWVATRKEDLSPNQIQQRAFRRREERSRRQSGEIP